MKRESEVLFERITEIDIKSRKLEGQYDVELPVRNYLSKIEKNIYDKRREIIEKQIRYIENKICLYDHILSLEMFFTSDVKSAFKGSSSFKEIDKKLEKSIIDNVPTLKNLVGWVDSIDGNGSRFQDPNNIIYKLESSVDEGDLKNSFDLVKKIEDNLNKACKENEETIKEILSEWTDRRDSFKEKGVKSDELDKIDDKFEDIFMKLESGIYLELFVQLDALQYSIEKLESLQKDYENMLSNVKELLDRIELPERKKEGYENKLDDIEKLENDYPSEINRLKRISDEIMSDEEKAFDIIGQIKQKIKDDNLLKTLSQHTGLILELENKLEQGELAYIMEEGKKHLENYEELTEFYKEDFRLLRELRSYVDNHEGALEHLENLDKRIASLEDKLAFCEIFNEESLRIDNYHEIIKNKLFKVKKDVVSFREELEGEIEEIREEAESKIRTAEKHIQDLNKDYNIEVDYIRGELESAVLEKEKGNFLRSVAVSEKVIDRVDQKIELEMNKRKISDILDKISPLKDKVRSENIRKRLMKIQKIVNQEDYHDEQVELAKEIEREVKNYLQEKIKRTKNQIIDTRDIGLNIDRPLDNLDEAEEYVEEGNYSEVLDLCEKSFEIVYKEKENYRKFKEKYDRLIEEIEQSSYDNIEIGEIEKELKDFDESDDYGKNIEKLEGVEAELNEKFKDWGRSIVVDIESKKQELVQYEEGGVDFGYVWNKMGGAIEDINEIQSIRNREDRENILKAHKKKENAFDRADEIIGEYKELSVLIKDLDKRVERAKDIGLSTEQLEKELLDIKEEIGTLKEILTAQDKAKTIEEKLSEIFLELEKRYKQRLEDIEEKVERYRIRKCSFRSFTDKLDSIENKLKGEEFEEVKDQIEDLKNYIDNKIESFEKATRKKTFLSNLVQNLEGTNIWLDQKAIPAIFRYDDYDKADEDYEEMIMSVYRRFRDRYGDIEKELRSLDERITEIDKKSNFQPKDAKKIIEKGSGLLSRVNPVLKEEIDLRTQYICPGCNNVIETESEFCRDCGQEVEDKKLADDILHRIEACLQLEDLIKKARAHLEEFDQDKTILNENISELEELLPSLMESEIDIEDLIERTYSLTEKRTLPDALEESAQILEECKTLIDEYRERAEKEIQEARELFEKKERKGISVSEASQFLKQAEEEKDEYKFKRAIRHAQTSKNIAERMEGEYQEARESIDRLESKIIEYFRKGIYPIRIATELEQIKDIDDHSLKKKRARKLIQRIREKKLKKREEVEEKIVALSTYLDKIEDNGVNTKKVKETLDRAKNELENGEFNASLNSLVNAYETGRELKKGYKKARRILEDTKSQLDRFDEIGIDVDDLKERIMLLEEGGEYERLVDECQKTKDTLESRKSRRENMIMDRIEEIEIRFEELGEKGIDLNPCEEELARAKEEFEDQEYGSCGAILSRTEEMIEKRKSQYDEYAFLMEEVEKGLKIAKVAGIDIDHDMIGKRLEELKESIEYPTAISELEEIRDELFGEIDEIKLKAKSLLEELEGSVNSLTQIGMKIGIDTHIEDLEKGQNYFDQGRFFEAMERLQEGLRKVKEREKDYLKVKTYFAIANSLIELRDKKGEKVEGMRKKLLESKTEFNRYSDIDRKIDILDNLLSKDEKKSKELLKERYDELRETLREKRIEDGLKSKGIEKELEETISSLEDGEIKKLIETLSEMNYKKTKIEKKHEGYIGKIEEIELLKERLDRADMFLPWIEEYIEQARADSDYGNAISILEEVMGEVDDTIEESFEEKKRFIDSSIDLIHEIENTEYLDIPRDEISHLKEGLFKARELTKEEELEKFFSITGKFEEDLLEIKDRYKKALLNEADEVYTEIEKLDHLTDHTDDLHEQFTQIKDSIKEGELKDIGKDIDGLMEEVVELKDKISERDELLDDLEGKLDRFDQIGISVENVGLLPDSGLSEIKRDEDIDSSIELIKNICDELEETKEKWIEEKEEIFEGSGRRIEAIPEKHMDPSIRTSVNEVRGLFENGEYLELDERLKELESKISKSEKAWKVDQERIQLPFTHGIETELQIITKDGHWIEGDKMSEIFDHLLMEAKRFVYEKVKEKKGPKYILEKIEGIKIEKDKADNDAVHVGYEVDGEKKWFSIIGKDSHVTTTTNILEIQTPPCEYLKELEWWLKTVFEESYRAVKKLGTGLLLVSTGMNPVEGFSQGVTFGDHHHIGVPDDETRRAVYNFLRNYIPHLISLSVNSPLPGKNIPEIKKNQDNCLISPLSSLSLRLENNIGQLSCPPVLEDSDDESDYLKKVSRDKESSRMVDIYPFTRFGTIEIRITDTQITLSDRLSLAVLIQCISLKAKKKFQRSELSQLLPENTLLNLRENAFKSGLLSPFYASSPSLDSTLEEFYPELERYDSTKAQGNNPKFLKDGCIALIHCLKEEITELNLLDTQYLDPLFIKLFGPKSTSKIGPPITSSQYQLYLVRQSDHDLEEFLLILDEISSQSAAHPDFNPMIDEFGYPVVPEELQPAPVELIVESNEISYIEEERFRIETIVSLSNPSEEIMEDVQIDCRYLDEQEKVISEKSINILEFDENGKESLTFEETFDEDGEGLPNEIVLEVFERSDRLLNINHPLPSQTKVSLDVSYIGPKLYHADKNELEIPYSIDIKNLYDERVDGELKIIVEDEQGKTRDVISLDIGVQERETYASIVDVTSDWALNALENQQFKETEPLVIEVQGEREIFEIKAKLDIDGKSIFSKEGDSFEVML